MPSDSTSRPARIIEIVSGEPGPPAARRPRRIAVHPLALLGWPYSAGVPRLRFVLRRRERPQ